MELLEGLNETEKHAVRLIKSALDFYNAYDGTGLFSGPGRYAVLEGRVRIAAVQSRTLFEFWSRLLTKMQWPTPPKRADGVILPLLKHGDETGVLRVLAEEAPSIVMLARAWHDEDKAARKAAKEAWEEEAVEAEEKGVLFDEA